MAILQKEVDDSWALWHFAFVRNKNRDNKRKVTTTIMKTATTTKKKKPLTRDQLIEARERLHELNQEMEERKEEQLQIRNYIADHFHDSEDGAKTIKVEDVKFTVTRTINHSISREEAARCQEERPDLYATCLRFKPEVRNGELKKNPEFADYVVSKPGPPSVSFA